MAGTKILASANSFGTTGEPQYDTAGHGRRLRGWTPGLSGPNASIIYGAAAMRDRSRDLSRKFPLLAGAYNTISSNIVEAGIRALPKADSKQDRLKIKDAWEIWQRECDTEGIHSFPILQDMLVRERYEAGEVFIRHRPNADSSLLVPYQIQILEAEHVPYEMNEVAPNGNIIIAGIEFNRFGKRVAYHIYPEHPGDGITYKSDMKTVRVPANEVIHYFKVLRSGQVRGIPECFSAQAKSRDVMVYNEAELVKKQTASLMVGFITSPEGDKALNADADDMDADPGEAVAKLEPGSLMSLEPGEGVTFSNPTESGASYDPFMKRTYSEIAAALNMSYEEFSLDVSGISFSSIRAVLNQSQRKYKQEQIRFIDMVLMPIWKVWFDNAVLAGVFSFSDYIDNPRKYTRVLFQAPGWAYVNPQQEIAAIKEEIKAGLMSREQAAAERGNDIEEVDDQIARDKERAASKGLAFDVDISPARRQETRADGDTSRTSEAQQTSRKPEQMETQAEQVKPSKPAGNQSSNESEEKLSFNGAQVTAMLSVIMAAAMGNLPRDSAIAILKAVFGLSEDQADEIMGSIGEGFVPAETSKEEQENATDESN